MMLLDIYLKMTHYKIGGLILMILVVIILITKNNL